MEITAIMTPDPVTVTADADLVTAMRLMDPLRIRHLPVMMDGRLVGVVSDRNLLQEMGWLQERRADREKTVGDIMSAPAVTVTPEDSVTAVAAEFVTRNIGCLPVVSAEDGSLLGIITEIDLLQAFCEAVSEGTLAASANPSVQALMTTEPITCGPADTLGHAADICWSRHVRHLPVVEDERLLGVVTDRDIRRAIGLGRADDQTITDVMTRRPITLQPDDSLVDAAEAMLRYRISCLPVVQDDAFVGILTTADLIDHCMNVLWEA